MLNIIIRFSLKNKLIIGLMTLALVAYGIYEVQRLPIDAVPDITNNQIQIITVAPALGAPDVERLITFPIEQANKNIPGLIELRSFSRFGLSLITLVFEDAIDIYWARQQVAERLLQVQAEIPPGFGQPMLAPVTTGLGEIYQYVVRPKKGYEDRYDAMALRTIQDWIVRRQLLGVPGVAEVSSFGGLLKQYEVALKLEELAAYQTSIEEVFRALENNNQNTGGAYIEKNETVLFIRSEGLIGSIEDIGNIVVKNLPDGTPLLIRQLAELQLGQAPRYGAMTYNGTMEVSGAVVMMLKDGNSSKVIRRIKDKVAQIQETLPEGVVIEPFLDRTKMVNNAIDTVSKNLAEGAMIVVFVLVIFLGNLRAGFLVATLIPLSMLFAVIMMNLFGVSGNLMSLGALDFGLIIDGAVIIVESVMHRLSHSQQFAHIRRLSQSQMDEEVQKAATKMMNSAVFGQVIILIVYLPILSLRGIEGKMFAPMAQTVGFALIGALLLSLTYVPVMSSLLLSKTLRHKATLSDKMMAHLEKFYRKVLLKVLRGQKVVLIGVIVLLGLSFWILSRLGGEFIPSLPEGDFAVETRVLPGSNLKTSVEAVSKASKLLMAQFPEIEKIVSKTGSSEIPTDPMPMDASDMMIILKKRSEWTSASTYPELEARMAAALEDIPGVSFGFQYPVAMRFNELISGARQDVVVKIFGENLDTLAYYAEKLGRICQSVEGSTGLYVEPVTGMPQIVIRYHREAIAQYGVAISDINRIIKTAFAGESSGLVYEGERRFDLVLRLSAKRRTSLADVQELLISTPTGAKIPLSTVASVAIEDGPNQIQRESSQRRIIVGFNVRGRDVQNTVEELQQKVALQIKLPPGYYVSYGGAFENLQEAKDRLMIAVPIALLLIFLLLYFAFRSVKLGLLIFTAIPLSIIGGVFALALRGLPFSVSAGIGFIALFGVAVLNGIVLIAEFTRLKAEGQSNLKRIVLQGTALRLRPVLMTAFVASLGFLPMALSTGEGAEVQRPLATVVIGGLMMATFLTLFVLPILYLMFQGNKIKTLHSRPITMVFVLVLSVLALVPLQAQQGSPQGIGLEEALRTALENNLQVKNEALRAKAQQQLQHAAFDIPQSQLSLQYGQNNSVFRDFQIGIAQNFSFPTVYNRQKTLQEALSQQQLIALSLQEANLVQAVKKLFYTMLYLKEKEKILSATDSLYAGFLEKSRLRFAKGDANQLELATAEAQRGQIAIQLQQLRKDYALFRLHFQLLLNTSEPYEPQTDAFRRNLTSYPDSAMRSQHPRLRLLGQAIQVAEQTSRLEKAKRLPELGIGYFNTSIIGVGADDVFYDAGQRFQFIQASIGIPIFSRAQKARIASAKTQEAIAQNQYRQGLKQLHSEWQTALEQYRTALDNIGYYEANMMPQVRLMLTTADAQLQKGEINYLEWCLLINQATSFQSNYLDLVNELNQSIIQIEYLLD
ncbi:CusA/CzcA family heavy metal efflux RND transporter [Eisenibacter elegans]|uniref:CusA/CzcA family heavy metal efflux RND transporter n=1 Tax=Eisenibacter elegans TaxID=997 RepID=UPI00047B431F|nr:CusA/CzcA family heavy metal efflux RND transporter [Eisenibacter elegans]